MTRRTFYRNLAKVKDQFRWEIGPYGCLRGELKNGERFCPITAVYFAKTGIVRSQFKFDEVGDLLKLSYKDSNYIAKKADTVDNKTPGSKALLRAVGLS